jgi:hypothetical protein
MDFFTVPTVWFGTLFVFIVLRHDRRRIVHFNVTSHPTAEWTAQQILEAFPLTALRHISCEIETAFTDARSASKSAP